MRVKARMMGQQTFQVPTTSNLIFRLSYLEIVRSSMNASDGGTKVAKRIKKTLALIDLSWFKNSATMKDDNLDSGSSLFAPYVVSPSKTNLYDNPYYFLTSPTIIFIKDQLVWQSTPLSNILNNYASNDNWCFIYERETCKLDKWDQRFDQVYRQSRCLNWKNDRYNDSSQHYIVV